MTIRPASKIIRDLNDSLTGPSVTLHQILEAFHERGFGFLLLLFALPMALPVPVPPGINILLATPLVFLTTQQALGRHTVWMPLKLRHKTFSRTKFQSVLQAALPFLEKIELLIRPRLGFVTQGGFSNLIGVLGLIMALSVCVPLPLTNTVPSLGITLMALGVIMRDGLSVLAGAVIGTAWVIMLCLAILFLGAEGIDILKNTIKSLL